MNNARGRGAAGTIAAFVLLAGVCTAFALEPPTREQIERYKKDGTLASRIVQARSFGNHRIAPRLVSRATLKLRSMASMALGRKLSVSGEAGARIMAPPAAWQGMPTKGTVKVLALLIAFSDYPPLTTAETMSAKLFGDGAGGFPYESLRNYYRRSSYNQLEIQGDVLGWYTAPYTRASVVETDAGREALIKEALTYYDQQGHDFSQYDNDGDGAVDYFCVFWTGPHGEWASFWWGYYTGFSDSSFRLDGKRFSQYSWQWELPNYPSGTFSPITIIHETGHALGVPDYYDYDDSIGPRGGVGGLDIMDGNAGDHNCFSKFMLDWITPTVVATGPRTVDLRASGASPDALLFFPNAAPGDIFNEYFMVQNRFRTGNDTGLFTAKDGLLVWHVDARLNAWHTDYAYDNSYADHKLLKLVQADGRDDIETYASWADASDYYTAGMVLGPATVPNTDRYSGLATGMGISNITGTTTPISVEVFADDTPPTCSILNLTSGELIYDTIQLEVAAADDNGVNKVELYVDGVLKATATGSPFSFALDTRLIPDGTRSLTAIAYDTIMQKTSSTVSVLVDNIFAPLGFKAEKVTNRAAMLREYVNVLTWADNTANISVTKYRVYQVVGTQNVLLGEIAKAAALSSYQFLHRHVTAGQTYSYRLVPVGSLNREGDAAAAFTR